MEGLGHSAPVLAILLLAGCLNGLPLPDKEAALDQIPGLDQADFEDALLTMDLEGCNEIQLVLPANETNLREAMPEPHEPRALLDDDPDLALTLLHCEEATLDNASVRGVDILHVSAPTDRSDDELRRDDVLLQTLVSNETLVAHLQDAGVPAEEVDTVSRDKQATYEIADQTHVDMEHPDYAFQADLTAVSLDTELPFNTASALARQHHVEAPNRTLLLQPALNVTEIGGISVTLEPAPGTELAHLLSGQAAGYGYKAAHDARLGLLPTGDPA